MRAGKLDRAVTIQRAAVAGVSAAGTPTLAWSDLALLRAELVSDDSAETIRAGGGVEDEAVLVLRTRFMPGITNADRILFEGRILNIKGVTPIGRNRGLELRAVTPGAG